MVPPAVTFCCVQCRLLQAPTVGCAECGDSMTAPVELVRELLSYRDMRFASGRDWSLITAFLAGSSLALPLLMPFAIGSMVALGIAKLRGLRRRRSIVGIPMPGVPITPGATTLHGIARRFRGTVSSLLPRKPVLLEQAVIRDRSGALLLRRSEAAPFLLEIDGEGPVLVTGVTRVNAPSLLAQKIRVKRGDPALQQMGVPDDLAIAGELEIAAVVEDSPGLQVTGVIEDEAVAELAFHRDGGQIRVMRGRVGAPVLVEDRRLIGVAL